MAILLLATTATPAISQTQVVNLTMAYQQVNLADASVKAITVNGQIPAPELRFTEGDEVVIHLTNNLDEPGSIHWHGLLVPYKMDGVPWVNMPPVMPGETFQYRFTLRQSGTYWYHSHSKFHEQQGLYGAFIVDPKPAAQQQKTREPQNYDRDITVMLSDWANRDPDETYRNLKKDGDYYKQFRPSWQFYWEQYKKASPEEKAAIRNTIAHMQQMRMGVWDWGDVAYDAFLLNGKPPASPWSAIVNQGEKIRLRIINGGASSYFNLKITTAATEREAEPFTVIAVDGQAIEPVQAERLLLGMAETYDILVNIEHNSSYAIYAEAQDRTGHSIGLLKTDPGQPDNMAVTPFSDPWFESEGGAHGHHQMKKTDDKSEGDDHTHHPPLHHTRHHAGHNPEMSEQTMDRVRKLDYANLKSTFVTNNPEEPAIDITLRLTGNMERYIWSFNDIRYRDAKPIIFEEGKTYRLHLINETMMHHPIHIHGHWFVLDNGNGKFNPRKHTIDVPPMGTRVAKVHAQDNGKWLFHCHNLYHMKAGMTRLIKYSEVEQE